MSKESSKEKEMVEGKIGQPLFRKLLKNKLKWQGRQVFFSVSSNSEYTLLSDQLTGN